MRARRRSSPPKGPALIFLAFLLPLAVYLLILGNLNHREHPVLVPGTWDFAGILFALSGFLLLAGPGMIGNFSERARLFWMFGEGSLLGNPEDGALALWVSLSVLYFGVVAGGAALLLWRQRAYASIYNAALPVIERALNQACLHLGLHPTRSGNLFLFGVGVPWSAGRPMAHDGIQSPSRSGLDAKVATIGAHREAPAQNTVLELEEFAWLRHVTLRWDPPAAELRHEIEGELRKILAETPPPDYAVGFWMTLLGQGLFVAIFLGALVVTMLRMLH